MPQSSMIFSILIAPRTLQTMANDKIIPIKQVNSFLATGRGESNEPFNATIVTAIIVFVVVSMGNVDFVAQIVQTPGISGMENNSILFEFHHDDVKDIPDILDGCRFALLVDYNICVLRSSERHFGYKKDIHIWLTPGDYRNANLMILIAYIIMGHPEWKGCKVELFAAFEEKELNKEFERLNKLINEGRIPISNKNVIRMPWDKNVKSYEALVKENSGKADLVILGFSITKLTQEGGEFFKKFSKINEVLFVRAGQKIAISEDL